MKKTSFLIFCLLLSSLFEQSFAQQKPAIRTLNNVQAAQPYKVPDYNDTRRYILYTIDGVRVNAYDRYNGSYITFFDSSKYQANFQNLTRSEKFRGLSYSVSGKYLIAQENRVDLNEPYYAKTYIYDLTDNSIVLQSNRIKHIQLQICKDFYYFFAEANNKEKYIIDKNGKFLARTNNLFHIHISNIDGYFELTHSMGSSDRTRFKLKTIEELASVINEIESNDLKNAIEVNNYYVKKGDSKYVGYMPKQYYDFKEKKYRIKIDNNSKTLVYDSIKKFYHYYLIKENGFYGIASEKGDFLYPISYDLILVEDENNVELCKAGVCTKAKLTLEKEPPSYIKQQFQEQRYHQQVQNEKITKRNTQPRKITPKKNVRVKYKKTLFENWFGIETYGGKTIEKPIYERVLYAFSESNFKAILFTINDKTIYNKNGKFSSNQKLNGFELFIAILVFLYRHSMLLLF